MENILNIIHLELIIKTIPQKSILKSKLVTTKTQLSSISFEKRIGPNVRVRIWDNYTRKDRVLKKFVKIGLKKADTETYIEDEAQVKSYLEQYGITAKDLDSYYDEIINQKVLKDWCSIYDSKYSLSNYGEVKIETQWENW